MMLVRLSRSKQRIPSVEFIVSQENNGKPGWYELSKVNRRKTEEIVVETVEEIDLQDIG